MQRICFVLALVACGGSTEPAAPPPATAPSGPIASPAAAPDDVIVATVDGLPVWGSCVAGQVERSGGKLDRKAALQECIAFELLAREAARRGLAGAPEVRDATKQAMVSTFVAREFEDKHRTPADMRQAIDNVIDRNKDQLDRPELRASTFVRVDAPEKTTSAEQDAKARALADQIYAELGNQTGLFPNHLIETAKRLVKGTGLTVTDSNFRAASREALVPAYRDALFGIPEVGRIARPARTEWGWDIILWTEAYPALTRSREEVAEQLFPEGRRAMFQRWSMGFVRALGSRVQVNPDALAELEESAAGSGSGSAAP
jgi:peptidyl-prolyl cis-trans isomerase C